ncbi:hypothetical protein A2982_03245 [candidate division WWE3 bacterium RIFCSPLOWO2_01_FULL_39_13]|uniref:Nudix hydrolase domain-containing protein n=1 Tax=candidate division WWE3 bacterium RIFCSPLOWO2_01_FULL_39_13 TaxID=1802624 RepID=A0A1F4V3L3_UNCKA|nr:MAG: hypothetical protein A2982_03245 [candidate division WWE3 bacterium RIFCSPLOWO2_01_FULL_39_13]
MPTWVSPQEAERRLPGFFKERGENAWKLDVPSRRMYSRSGFAQVRVQTKPDGSPYFDHVVYGEAPGVNAVTWGVTEDGIYKVAVVVQARPFADTPDGQPADPPIIFGQPAVMGSLKRVVGEEETVEAFEKAEDCALREAVEEAGVGAIKAITLLGYHNPNPASCATWSELLDIEVDLTKVSEHTDKEELIFRAEYLPVREILRRIGVGEHEGVNYRSATANSAFLVWLCRHPEALENKRS